MYGGYSGYASMGNNYGGLNSYSSPRSNRGGYGSPQGPNDPRDQNNQDPERSSRKNIMQEWFKMMGGLKSVLELGFAAITIVNFYTHISTMAKKIAGVIKGVMGAIFSFLHKRVAGTVLSKLTDPSTRMRALKKITISFVRVLSVLLLCLAAKLKNEIRKESNEKLQKL